MKQFEEAAAEEEDSIEHKKPQLTTEEAKDVEKRGTPRAAVVYETVREEGEFEMSRTVSALAWSALAAGLSMGFSLVAEGLLRSHLPDTPWRPLVAKFGYSAGFLIVILGRQQLFTENTLTVILPLLLRKNRKTLFCVARLWSVVFLANVVGAFIFAFVISHTAVFSPEIKQAFADIGREASEGDWTTIFLRAIFAGWLIALMVWLLPAAETARIWVIIIMTYLVALGGYSHIIAGSVEVFYSIMNGDANWSKYFFDWMPPTLLGNILGGFSLVAVLGHAQVVNESNERKDNSD
ncbi:MAG: formate/nitrite transporter family protein [Acidobacteriota bacterium]|nr:formate/nitrite transporter family protein [Acidobacteriota bacterium]